MSERSEFWLSHLSAIEAEGITTKAYAQREGLSPQALYQWRKRLVADARPRRTQRGGFAAIQIEPSSRLSALLRRPVSSPQNRLPSLHLRRRCVP